LYPRSELGGEGSRTWNAGAWDLLWMLTLAGSSMKGPWGAAQMGIHKALARNGVISDFQSYDGEAESLPAHHRGEVDIGVNFREQVMFAYRGVGAYAKD